MNGKSPRLEFQFTPLREGLRLCYFYASQRRISIHAPARGASRFQKAISTAGKFQFTPLREGLHYWNVNLHHGKLFQFTPLREGLRWSNWDYREEYYFNSRPCERGFVAMLNQGVQFYISIHAPARGASCIPSVCTGRWNISIHAPAVGQRIEGDANDKLFFRPLKNRPRSLGANGRLTAIIRHIIGEY